MPIPTKPHVDFRPEDAARFWSKVDVKDDDDCWLWTAGKFSDGYGQFKARRPYRAHRVAYLLFGGVIPDGMLVCHGCDNPLCCNPSHLFVGTCSENHADRNAKGRQAKGERHGFHTHPESRPRGDRHGSVTHPERLARGIKNGNAKLTNEQVTEIRQRYATNNISQTQLAKDFGVGLSLVNAIVNGKARRL